MEAWVSPTEQPTPETASDLELVEWFFQEIEPSERARLYEFFKKKAERERK